MTKEDFALCKDIEANIADEAEARKGYYHLMENYSHLLTRIEIGKLEDIIAEELKHTKILSEMVYKRSAISAESGYWL